MKLTVWTYEGPPHVGAMRVATAMKGLHYVLHAPQGDTYADLLFTMIERRSHRPPVTYTTFRRRAIWARIRRNCFKRACRDAYDRFKPQAMIVGASCTAELIQDDPGGLAETMGLPVPVIALELPSYQRKENFGADETLFQIVRTLAKPVAKTDRITCNLIGPTRAGLSASRRYRGTDGSFVGYGRRCECLRADGCDAFRHRPAGCGAFQRADVSRNMAKPPPPHGTGSRHALHENRAHRGGCNP
jgi:light-independent protochlorophyllide reductase B subunit